MNLCRLTFPFDGHTVAVSGYRERGYAGDWIDPPEPESFSIAASEIVTQAHPDEPVGIDDLDEEDLADAALVAWHARDDQARAEHADLRRGEAAEPTLWPA